MEIGLKIKSLRLKHGITQEKLAYKLSVTPQAISKWENGNATPDISLLPELSVIFGVTIDELFSLTDESHMDRIEQSIYNEFMLTRECFDKYNDFLLGKLNNDSLKPRALSLLAEINLKQAEGHKIIAKDYALQALELNPEDKGNHTDLRDATNGVLCDWNITNHHVMIEYYMNFIKKNPTYARGYLWLLDLLIADGRCDEARVILEKMHSYDDSFRYLAQKAQILKAECKLDEALCCINEMTEKYPQDWMVWSTKADFLAGLCKYDEAIKDYEKACSLQPSPKYTDSYEAIAHIYEIKKDYKNSIVYYNKVIDLLKSEWNITDGETVNAYKKDIERLTR